MKSFRTEIENPIVEKDIIELEKKIHLFKEGKLDEDSFRSLRLARGVYGQRQKGVQMVRIKLPLGIITPQQLIRIANISDRYSNGNLHLTTRQDVQIHYVSLNDTPELWAELEKDEITLREACGNTVRNITSSPFAGIDDKEPFDITPFGWSLYKHLLRNPIGQDMGRKFKIAFSSSDKDTARTYLHDLGIIPKIKYGKKGFKLLLGGGLGAQPHLAVVFKEYIDENELIPYTEAILKVFDKYGERNRRNKARFKFLIQESGNEIIFQKIEREFNNSTTKWEYIEPTPVYFNTIENHKIEGVIDFNSFEKWKKTNVKTQKQSEYLSVIIKVRNGNISSNQAKDFAEILKKYSADSARITIEQNLLIRFIPIQYLPNLYNELNQIGLADYGAETIKDITSCPGTETCNLGITGTYHAAKVLEKLLENEFEEIILHENINIKMSGCMNSCGQHAASDIGFHGSSIKKDQSVFPAVQILLGGYNYGDGNAKFGDKIIKIPTKRIENAVRIILNDYQKNKSKTTNFHSYYLSKDKNYFYELLKDLADLSQNNENELLDWGMEERFKTEIGVGECAGVKIDLVRTLFFEAKEKIEEAKYFIQSEKWNDAIYITYSSIIEAAKSFLVKNNVKTNSKKQIEEAFEVYYPLIKNKFNEKTFKEFLEENNTYREEKRVNDFVKKTELFLESINELINKIEDENK